MKRKSIRNIILQLAVILSPALLFGGCMEPGVKSYVLDFEGDYAAHFGDESLTRIWRGSGQVIQGREIAIYNELGTTGSRFIVFCQRPPRGTNDTGLLNSESGNFRAYMVYGYAPGKDGDAIPDLELLEKMWRQKDLESNPAGPPYICRLQGSLRLVMRSEGNVDRIAVDLVGTIPLVDRQTIPTSAYTREPVPSKVKIKGDFVGRWNWVHPEGYVPL
jgi:hypothetical protein